MDCLSSQVKKVMFSKTKSTGWKEGSIESRNPAQFYGLRVSWLCLCTRLARQVAWWKDMSERVPGRKESGAPMESSRNELNRKARSVSGGQS